MPFVVVRKFGSCLNQMKNHADVATQYQQFHVDAFDLGIGDMGVIQCLKAVEAVL